MPNSLHVKVQKERKGRFQPGVACSKARECVGGTTHARPGRRGREGEGSSSDRRRCLMLVVMIDVPALSSVVVLGTAAAAAMVVLCSSRTVPRALVLLLVLALAGGDGPILQCHSDCECLRGCGRAVSPFGAQQEGKGDEQSDGRRPARTCRACTDPAYRTDVQTLSPPFFASLCAVFNGVCV